MKFCLALLTASAAMWAAPVYDTTVALADYTGSRSIGSGLTGAGSFGQNFQVDWNIVNNGNGTFSYTYTISNFGGKGGGLSHIIVDLSDVCLQQSGCVDKGEIGTYSSTSQGNSNPNLPAVIVGVKVDTGGSSALYTITFLSDRLPVWGDFYAKGGKFSKDPDVFNSVWNNGNPNHLSESKLDFIARPDSIRLTGGDVPEPGSLMLLGGGLLALGFLRKR